MNELLLKQIAILSAIAGGILGVIALIPYINLFAISVLVLCLSAVIIVYMKKKNQIGIIDLKEGGILGALSGFVSFLAFAAVFVPLDMIVLFIFKLFKSTKTSIFQFFFNDFGSFIVLIMLVVFLAMLSALMNSFAGLATAYVYEILSGFKKEENAHFDIEIK